MLAKNHTFMIDIDSDVDERSYRGNFTCKRLSVMDRTKINIRKSQLCGGMYCVRDENGKPTGMGIDTDAEFFNYCLAFLESALLVFPEWWNTNEISDDAVVMAVFKEAFKFENSFRNRGLKDQDNGSNKDSSGNSETQHTVSNDRSGPKKVVDSQVSAALEP